MSKYRRQVAVRSFFSIFIPLFLTLGSFIFLSENLELSLTIAGAVSAIIALVSILISTMLVSDSVSRPIGKLVEIIGYATHNDRHTGPPNIETLRLGRELVTAQSHQIYELASSLDKSPATAMASSSVELVPLPIIGVDANQIVVTVNSSFSEYIGKPNDKILGQPLNDVINLNFQEDETLDVWLKNVKDSSVKSVRTWDSVRYVIDEDNYKQFDMAVSFSSGSQSGTETMIAFFDHTDKYRQDDNDINYVSLAVHELRTPLTIMRGYIEVFEDELGPTLTPELTDFMHKMHASSDRLTDFVGNILNVARIEENQLTLKLKSENWTEILTSAISDLQLRASVHGIHLELKIAENIPAVGVDRISIHEVINNLIDNAIKYSGKSDRVLVSSQLNQQGVVETSIQDFGLGIPDSVITQLFKKYHRSHKSRNQISGTGLGLYLSKALVSAHGGNIWVRSKEGEGSVFSFTILPFDQLSAEQVAGEDGIIRGAHGWIKNHSLYRN